MPSDHEIFDEPIELGDLELELDDAQEGEDSDRCGHRQHEDQINRHWQYPVLPWTARQRAPMS